MNREETIRKFLQELDDVCKKHGLGITHEDSHGAFLLVTYEQNDLPTETIRWDERSRVKWPR